jgi:hypothetical protein
MYCGKNFANKEDLEKAIRKGEKVTVFLPYWVKRRTGLKCPKNGITNVLGPHFHIKTSADKGDIPECRKHEWEAAVRIENGVIKEVF